MTDPANIARLGVIGLSTAFATGALSPDEVLRAYARRIDELNPALNAFLDLDFKRAGVAADASSERWRRGAPLSSIDGVPFGVKANIAVAHLPWHGGISAYRNRIASQDSAIAKRLRQAGAIPLGILNMHEGALGATTDNPHFGRCHNPWGDNMTPGGSSGGSGAAVAAGLCAFALGTDTMGSVRIPSAYCGVAGMKPSYGLIPSEGLVELSPTLDHIGPHARDAADLACLLPYLIGAKLPSSHEPLRYGVAAWGDAVQVADDVGRAFVGALSFLSPDADIKGIDLSEFDFGAVRRRGLLISEVEGARAHKKMMAADAAGFSDEFRNLLLWGVNQPSEKLEKAYTAIRAAGAAFNALFDNVDVIVLPTTPQGPFAFGGDVPANQADFTCMANFAGAPAVAVPASRHGAPPASVQFVAKPGADHVALAAAVAFERARGAAPAPDGYI